MEHHAEDPPEHIEALAAEPEAKEEGGLLRALLTTILATQVIAGVVMIIVPFSGMSADASPMAEFIRWSNLWSSILGTPLEPTTFLPFIGGCKLFFVANLYNVFGLGQTGDVAVSMLFLVLVSCAAYTHYVDAQASLPAEGSQGEPFIKHVITTIKFWEKKQDGTCLDSEAKGDIIAMFMPMAMGIICMARMATSGPSPPPPKAGTPAVAVASVKVKA